MLVKENVKQAVAILNEFDIDCWIEFTRERQINGDPLLAFHVSSDVTWHSALIISKSGRTHAIVGRHDVASIEDTEAYDEVLRFAEGFMNPFQRHMRTIDPQKIALNYSEGSEI